jgi:hypothetical protein
MTDLIERTLHRPEQQRPGRTGRARPSTATRRKTSRRPFEPHARVISRCRCAAEATTGPVAPCAIERSGRPPKC